MIHSFHLKEPVYSSETYVFLGDGNRDEMIKSIQRKFKMKYDKMGNLPSLILSSDVNGLFAPLLGDGEELLCFIILIIDVNKPTTNETIAHECIHASMTLFEHYGIEHDKKTDEAFAYLHGFFFHGVLEFLKLFRKKIENENKPDIRHSKVPRNRSNNKRRGSRKVRKV